MHKPVVLIVDDSEDDFFIFQKAVQRAKLDLDIHRVNNGQAAIDYLSGAGAFHDRAQFPLPSVIVLDFQLPRVSGLEILAWARSHDDFKRLPILMLSGSTRFVDEDRARQLGVTRVFEKTPTCKEVMAYIAGLGLEPRKAAA